MGVTTDRHQKAGHTSLSAFGGGKEHDIKAWASIFRQLIAMGYLTLDGEGHGSLLLTPQGLEVLQQQIVVRLRKERPLKREKLPRTRGGVSEGHKAFQGVDGVLWESLRLLRRELAKEANVAPYVIFHDSTLRDMLEKRPQTLSALGQISGVGEQKLARFGPAFLEVLRAHAAQRSSEETSQTTLEELPTAEITMRLHRQGLSPEAIAAQRGLSLNSIYTHLAAAIADGRINLRSVLPLTDDELAMIKKVIFSLAKADQQRLRPIYDALHGQYNFDTIRCVQADLAFRFGLE